MIITMTVIMMMPDDNGDYDDNDDSVHGDGNDNKVCLPMMTEENEISLVVERDASSSMKLGVIWK